MKLQIFKLKLLKKNAHVILEYWFVLTEDINEGRIYFLRNATSNATDDAFFFKLRDKGIVYSYNNLKKSQK